MIEEIIQGLKEMLKVLPLNKKEIKTIEEAMKGLEEIESLKETIVYLINENQTYLSEQY